ncbi:hypothetical protein CBOVI_04375 [Corynebacterium bovis DSM 20582 = CIP 54.80]|uniref:Uncharacterized protein n=1 Tax=Corynebacterium bovis DSM 20582 = CIP 54.80 TaxID=927655 RepID=A0A8I0CMZ7_9CORY|nr:hypothetical protein [Corynebacterium bovis DSM 20582 = CIP 54.80]WJY77403.1 hypothetical protein CBOVI_04375 [Corynebacterium bovis DSM 20582 = CIP 54.80]
MTARGDAGADRSGGQAVSVRAGGQAGGRGA